MLRKKGRHNNRSDHSKSKSTQSDIYHSNSTPPVVIKSKRIYVASALNQQQGLLFVYGCEYRDVYSYIYTLDGYLVTFFRCNHTLIPMPTVHADFSDEAIMILSVQGTMFNKIYTYTDYCNDFKHIEGTVFDSHKNGDIYVAGSEQISVSIYSKQFQFKRYFEINQVETGKITSLLIRDNLLVVLLKCCEADSPPQPSFVGRYKRPIRRIITPECKIYRYCLRTEELLQRWDLSDRFNFRMINNSCFVDRYMNVLMECDSSKGYCVWDTDGRISYYQLKHKNAHPVKMEYTIGCSLTDDNQLIYVLSKGCIKNFNIL